MSPGFIVADYPGRRVIGFVPWTRLVTVRLTAWLLVRACIAEVFRHAAESPLAAAHIERTLLAGVWGILAALCFGITV